MWEYVNLDVYFFFFFNDTATTEIYTLSLHDALPICELGHAGAQIKFIKSERPADWVSAPVEASPPATTVAAKAAVPPAPQPKAGAFNKDDFKNDPLIQKALEIFKGQIVEVRT